MPLRLLGRLAGVAVLAAACTTSGHGAARAPTTIASSPTGQAPHARGGLARVGVWEPPDATAPTLEGAAVRALVLPQLFVAQPDGSWAAALVERGTDKTSADARSASFRLRRGAVWSDGSPITVADLQRSADHRQVAAVEGPDSDGTIRVRFTEALAGWQRLWSGVDAVTAPRPGVWGGPFVVASSQPGLQTVLHRNDRWWGAPAPYLDEVDLVLVPDSNTARQLLARGELDIVMPPAATVRTQQLRNTPGVEVATAAVGGWSVQLVLNPARLDLPTRQALVAAIDRQRFVDVLLAGEAKLQQGFNGASDTTWAGTGSGAVIMLAGKDVPLLTENEEPMSTLLGRAIQRKARAVGGTVELQAADAERVESWVASQSFAAAGIIDYLGPKPCWVCRWGTFDPVLAAKADGSAGPQALEEKLRDQAIVVPLWQPITVVAWRSGLNGVRANGYALDGAWDAWEWWRPAVR